MKSQIAKVGLTLSLIGLLTGNLIGQNVKAYYPEVNLQQSGLNDVNPAVQQQLRQQSQWQNFKDKHPSWQVWFDEKTGMPHKVYGKPINVEGDNLKDLANRALQRVLKPFELDNEQLQLSNIRKTSGEQFVSYQQYYKGKKVITGEVELRFTKEGKLTQFSLDYYPGIGELEEQKLSWDAIKKAAQKGLKGPVNEVKITGETAILPNQGEYHLVQEVFVKGKDPYKSIPVNYKTLVDVNDGTVLYRNNKVVEAEFEDIPIESTVVDEDPTEGDSTVHLPYLEVEADGQTFYTDENGRLDANVPNGTQATYTLKGRFASVQDEGETPPSFQATLDTSGSNTASFDNTAGLDQRSGYYHTNIIHDYMKSQLPGFTALDNPIDVNTSVENERLDGCNAFYIPRENSLNFFADNSRCPSFAKIGDIVYHEYGHAINSQYYISQGERFENGGLGEAMADIWALGVTENPLLGEGITENGSRDFIRRYDINPKVYPEDLTGEPHDNGEILAGAFWQVGQNLDSIPHMMDLFSSTYKALPDAPEGNEGQLYRDVLLEVLRANDDDNNLSNGTPDYDAITSAFAKHGISLLAGLDLQHQQKTIREPNQTTDFKAEIQGNLVTPLGKIQMNYRLSEEQQWQQTTLQKDQANNVYNSTIQGKDTGDLMLYYFEVFDSEGNIAATYPNDASKNINSSLPYHTLYGFGKVEHDSLNSSADWSIKGDAESGAWEIASPVGSYIDGEKRNSENLVQPSSDHTGGPINSCAVTENAPNNRVGQRFADIDNGETILISPYFEIDTLKKPVIGYHRWFSNATGANPGNDPFEVYIQTRQSNNWQQVAFTFKEAREWRQRIVDIHDQVGKQAKAIRLRFIASDRVKTGERRNGQSIVEAAVDDVILYEKIRQGFQPVGLVNETKSRATLNAYPNPTSGQVRLNRTNDKEPVEAVILNGQGQVLKKVTLKSGTTNIDLSRIGTGKGLYVLRWAENGSVKTKRLLYR